MPTEKYLTNFVINKVPTKSIFNKMKTQGLINDDEIYLVEEDDQVDYLPLSGGIMAGSITTKGIVLTSGTDYGSSLPSSPKSGQLFFQTTGSKFVLDNVYPVGAVYISINSTSPQTLFGGTWKQIQGQFLLGASSAYPAGSTGGSKDAVVVAHSHNPANQSGYYGFITSASKAFTVGDMGSQSGSGRYYPFSTSDYDISRNTQTGSTGVSGTDKNMPPYICVYMWYRTA